MATSKFIGGILFHHKPGISFGRRGFHRRLFTEGIMIGCLAGLVVSAFRYLLELPEVFRPTLVQLLQGSYLYLALYGLGLALAGIFLCKIVAVEPLTSGSGIPQLKGELEGDISMNWIRVLVLKFIGGVMAIGCGLSLGREGPSVQLGGCVGKGVSLLEHRPQVERRFLLMAGSGAGLAAAFNAPLAGVIFCLEELSHSFSPTVFTGTIAASVAATVTSRFFFGASPVFNIPPLPVFSPVPSLNLLWEYALFALLGIFVGWLAKFFTPALTGALDWYGKNLLFLWRPLVPLAMAGVLLFILPEILGGGANLVNGLAATDFNEVTPGWLMMLGGLFLAKFSFTVICFGSGVPGGIFLPMLVLGAVGGAFFAAVASLLGVMPNSLPLDGAAGLWDIAPYGGAVGSYAAAFIVFGMAGYFAAVVKAPVTGSILIMEMTGSYPALLPLVAVTISAYVTADSLGVEPVYDVLLERTRRLKGTLTVRKKRLRRKE